MQSPDHPCEIPGSTCSSYTAERFKRRLSRRWTSLQLTSTHNNHTRPTASGTSEKTSPARDDNQAMHVFVPWCKAIHIMQYNTVQDGRRPDSKGAASRT